MVGGDVEQHGDIEGERLDQVELERTRLQHIDPVGAERRQRQRRRAEIAADLDPPAGLRENVADQRRRRRFAVGAGDPDIARLGLRPPQQVDVADDLDAGLAGATHRRMRLGEGQRDAGRQHQRRDAAPVDARRIDAASHLGGGRLARLGAVVPGQHLGAAFRERAHRGTPGARETQHRDPFSGKFLDDDHRLHRSFSVESPAIARMIAMIQKRITIFGSSQPSCSK